MKQLIYILCLMATANLFANDYIKDAEPTILEVHYTRTEMRDSYQFQADGLMQNSNSKVGIYTYDERRGYTTVISDKS